MRSINLYAICWLLLGCELAIAAGGGKAATNISLTLDSKNEGWNQQYLAEFYHHNSHLQLNWAMNVIGKYHNFIGNEKIFDFGSGQGQITSILASFAPQGRVIGYDISQHMINLSSAHYRPKQYPNLQFKKLSDFKFSPVDDEKDFDLATSFCVLHLVGYKVAVIKNIAAKLKVGGKFLGTFPSGVEKSFFDSAKKAFKKYKLEAPPSWKSFEEKAFNSEQFTKILSTRGFLVEKAEDIATDDVYENKARFVDWCIGTMSANWNIPQDLQKDFFEYLASDYASTAANDNGRIHFKGYRIDFLAVKTSL